MTSKRGDSGTLAPRPENYRVDDGWDIPDGNAAQPTTNLQASHEEVKVCFHLACFEEEWGLDLTKIIAHYRELH